LFENCGFVNSVANYTRATTQDLSKLKLSLQERGVGKPELEEE